MTTTREILDWLVEVELDRTPRSDEVLTEEDLAAWLPGCPDAAQAEAREAVVAMGLIGPTATGSVWSDTPFAHGAGSPTDDPNEAIREVPLESWRWQAMGDPPREARKAAVAELREHVGAGIDFDAVLAIFESHGEIVKRPRLVFMAPLRIDASGVFEPGAAGGVWELAEVHRRWLDIREADRPRHPLAPLVAAWLNRPRPVERRHVTVPAYVGDRALVRSPALLDLASFGSLNEIEVIEVDAEPIVSRTATIDGLKHRRPRKQAYRREPMQGELIPGPRTLSGEHIGDVVLRALSLYALAGDERNPIRGDIYRLALATFAISGAMTIQPAAGVNPSL